MQLGMGFGIEFGMGINMGFSMGFGIGLTQKEFALLQIETNIGKHRKTETLLANTMMQTMLLPNS